MLKNPPILVKCLPNAVPPLWWPAKWIKLAVLAALLQQQHAG
jgi:hypothetical protein